MVLKLQMSCRKIYSQNKLHIKTDENQSQLVTTAKNRVTIETNAVNSNDKKDQTQNNVNSAATATIIIVFRQTPTPIIKPPPWRRRRERQNQIQQKNTQSNPHGNFQAAAQTSN